MKKINLDLPYNLKSDDEKMFPEPRLVTEYVLRALVNVRYPQGINRTDMRIWANVMDLMHTGNKVIEVDKSTLLWILDVLNWCMDNSKIPPLMASWINMLANHLEQCKREGETDLKAVK